MADEPRQQTLRVAVSEKLCSGQGRCYTLSPDVFHSDDEGYCVERGSEFEVPTALKEQALVGRDACPEGAITLAENRGA